MAAIVLRRNVLIITDEDSTPEKRTVYTPVRTAPI